MLTLFSENSFNNYGAMLDFGVPDRLMTPQEVVDKAVIKINEGIDSYKKTRDAVSKVGRHSLLGLFGTAISITSAILLPSVPVIGILAGGLVCVWYTAHHLALVKEGSSIMNAKKQAFTNFINDFNVYITDRKFWKKNLCSLHSQGHIPATGINFKFQKS
jgi:hypothetical protein